MAMTRGLYLRVGALVAFGIPPTDGLTGAGTMPRGSLYVDAINGLLYINRGTKADPHWFLAGTTEVLNPG
jgi:hypothetical protein